MIDDEHETNYQIDYYVFHSLQLQHTFIHKTRHFLHCNWIALKNKNLQEEKCTERCTWALFSFRVVLHSLIVSHWWMHEWMHFLTIQTTKKETVRNIQHASIQSIVCTLNGNKSQIWLGYNRNNSQTYSSSIGHLLNMRALCMIRNGQK